VREENTMTFTVKQLSDKYNLSAHTIRFYDDQGLFPDVTRNSHGTRLFSEEHLDWVNLVLCLRNTGMSIADIKHFIELSKKGDSSIPERYDIILNQKKKAEDDLKEMQKRLEVLCHKECYYKGMLEKKSESA
jgi:DNA-binding transcriptional MerR regulator